MSNTINNGIPLVPENTIDPAAALNLSLVIIDRLLQLSVLAMKQNTPATGMAYGSRYIVGSAPTGAWTGKALQCAEWMQGDYWAFSPAKVAVFGTSIYLNTGSDWVPSSAGGGTAWGGITGALADQADLVAALALKANASSIRPVLGATGEVYSQSGILGVVSQSAGVPTGAIIEYGSNSNGSYYKFAGGMLICIGSVSVTGTTGAVTASGTWVHPSTFSDAGSVYSNGRTTSAPAGAQRERSEWCSISATLTTINFSMNTAFASDVTAVYRVFAIGRWYNA